jgi:hypothetical protein
MTQIGVCGIVAECASKLIRSSEACIFSRSPGWYDVYKVYVIDDDSFVKNNDNFAALSAYGEGFQPREKEPFIPCRKRQLD